MDRCPVLKLANAKGISNDKVLKLEEEIQCMAADLVGEVDFWIDVVFQKLSPSLNCF